MAQYRTNEDYASFENELREAFSVARDQLDQEEVRIINLYRNLPKRAYHRTSKKDAIIDQLTEICKDIDYKLISPKLSSIKTEAMKYFDEIIKQSQQGEEVVISQGEADSVASEQLAEFGQELKKTCENLGRVMYGNFLSDQSDSILQRMNGLKHKLTDSVLGQFGTETTPQLFVPDRHQYSSPNKRIKPEPRYHQAPLVPEPRYHQAPLVSEPRYYQAPLVPEPRYHQAPLVPEPRYHQAPLVPEPRYYQAPLVPEPRYYQAPLVPEPRCPQPLSFLGTEATPPKLEALLTDSTPKPPTPEKNSPLIKDTPPPKFEESEPPKPISPVEPPKKRIELEPIIAKGKPPDYQAKGRPIKSAGKFGTDVGQFKLPKGMAFDAVDNRIFIAESSNAGSRIQIYSVNENTFALMDQTFLTKPHAIAVSDEFLFITDVERNAIVQFNIEMLDYVSHNGGLGSRDGELNTPYGICVDKNLDVYVADSKNNRVSVFKKKLKFKENIGVDTLIEPKDVRLTKETVAVLDTNDICLHFFSRKTGDLLRSCITMGKGNDVSRPIFLYIDNHLNILISDHFGHAVQIFDQEGTKIHTIGGPTSGHGSGQLFSPTGLFVNKAGELVVVSCNKNNILQYF